MSFIINCPSEFYLISSQIITLIESKSFQRVIFQKCFRETQVLNLSIPNTPLLVLILIVSPLIMTSTFGDSNVQKLLCLKKLKKTGMLVFSNEVKLEKFTSHFQKSLADPLMVNTWGILLKFLFSLTYLEQSSNSSGNRIL